MAEEIKSLEDLESVAEGAVAEIEHRLKKDFEVLVL